MKTTKTPRQTAARRRSTNKPAGKTTARRPSPSKSQVAASRSVLESVAVARVLWFVVGLLIVFTAGFHADMQGYLNDLDERAAAKNAPRVARVAAGRELTAYKISTDSTREGRFIAYAERTNAR